MVGAWITVSEYQPSARDGNITSTQQVSDERRNASLGEKNVCSHVVLFFGFFGFVCMVLLFPIFPRITFYFKSSKYMNTRKVLL